MLKNSEIGFFSEVLPSIRKYGYYKLFDNPNIYMFKIQNETDLHNKVVQYIRRFYRNAILIAGWGENQDTSQKRVDSARKGDQNGQPDIIIADNYRIYNGMCIEFKLSKNNYKISEAQLEMKEKYENNGYYCMISNDYYRITRYITLYMKNVHIPRKFCCKQFLTNSTYKKHLKCFHKIINNYSLKSR